MTEREPQAGEILQKLGIEINTKATLAVEHRFAAEVAIARGEVSGRKFWFLEPTSRLPKKESGFCMSNRRLKAEEWARLISHRLRALLSLRKDNDFARRKFVGTRVWQVVKG